MELREQLLKLFAELSEEEQKELLNYAFCSSKIQHTQLDSEFRHQT